MNDPNEVENLEESVVEVIDWKAEFEKQFDLFMFLPDHSSAPLELEDKRFKRIVISRRQVTIGFGGRHLRHLKENVDTIYPRTKDKYTMDWNRMWHTLCAAIQEAKMDPFSRQLVVSNMDGFYINKPCFLTMQFLAIPDLGFILEINQRSIDRIKFYDDLKLFGEVIAHFEKGTGYTVIQLDIIVGDLHADKTMIKAPDGSHAR